MSIHLPRGVIPIGVVIAWLKSFTGVPALATQGRDDFVEVNGQVITDVESPSNGETLPDINGSAGTQRFLRGSTTSGTVGGSETHTHTILGGTEIESGTGINCHTQSASTLPSYYEVVWIIRIK